MQTIIVHINSEDPVMGEVEELPNAQDQLIMVQNPRRRDGKDVHYIDEDVNVIIIPFHRVNFIQILPTGESEEIIGFVRE